MRIALIIIFNHKYEKNIAILDRLYSKRFSSIFFLMPFYHGDDQRVIPVYENSFFFQGYIAQGFDKYFNDSFDYYFFVSDDLILNPQINEDNVTEFFQVDHESCFIPEIKELHKLEKYWRWVREAFEFNIHRKGVEAAMELPSYEEALKLFDRHGFQFGPLDFRNIYRFKLSTINYYRFGQYIPFLLWLRKRLKYYKVSKFHLPYPVCGSYADILVINSTTIRKFAHYCGIFSALELFSELAIPTSLVFASRRIVTEKDISRKGRALWSKSDYLELAPYNNSLGKLFESFPENCLYYHPIKLSKWNVDKLQFIKKAD